MFFEVILCRTSGFIDMLIWGKTMYVLKTKYVLRTDGDKLFKDLLTDKVFSLVEN